MPKKTEITPKKRAVCIALKKEGLSCREIADRTGISKSSVDRAVHIFNETGQYCSRRRPGRPKITTSRDDLAIKRLIVKNPFMSCADVKAELPVKVSARTVRRRLVDKFNLRSHRAAKKPLLTKAQRTYTVLQKVQKLD